MGVSILVEQGVATKRQGFRYLRNLTFSQDDGKEARKQATDCFTFLRAMVV
ncbi:hypothetical protein AAC03nite_04130 [Alicyclobacillus acidoterrestris]|nr:hypothetical protein AAC03nite_04130 [Alicyclobacillus acidoterrestris]